MQDIPCQLCGHDVTFEKLEHYHKHIREDYVEIENPVTIYPDVETQCAHLFPLLHHGSVLCAASLCSAAFEESSTGCRYESGNNKKGTIRSRRLKQSKNGGRQIDGRYNRCSGDTCKADIGRRSGYQDAKGGGGAKPQVANQFVVGAKSQRGDNS
eukprot:8907254-Karenia_brevis.AAC.1